MKVILYDRLILMIIYNVVGNDKRIETWVKKESYSKLKGLGLQIGFQNVKLNEIKTKNFFIRRKEYMCSIYCDRDDVDYIELSVKGGVSMKKVIKYEL